MGDDALDNPILNGPYDPPDRHFEMGPNGPTGVVAIGRRPSQSFIPIPTSVKGNDSDDVEQTALDFDITGERAEANSLINEIRRQVELWRAREYPRVTPYSRKLLQHWAGTAGSREEQMLFCQREAAETAIYLAEVAGRHGEPDFRTRLTEQNVVHNAGLHRTALKMATGTGKTIVMAMLIAWQTINKVYAPRDTRFAKRFLVVAPGITIRDRLRVLQPNDPNNYYKLRDVVPDDLWPALHEAQIVITNYHTFLLRDAPEIKGVAANTRKILNAGKDSDAFKETPADMAARVMREFPGRGGGEIVVFNDEAHHCYRDKPVTDGDTKARRLAKEEREAVENARVWFRGLQALDARVGVKAVYDLSATPFYLAGSGYNEGYIFPWTVSDFSLMDAIESGIVKVPRVPIDDDAVGELPTYLRLWDHVGDKLPKKLPKDEEPSDWVPPKELEGALESLHRSYEVRFAEWEAHLRDLGEPPPVMIIVCTNTTQSRLVYDWIAGTEMERPDGTLVLRPGKLDLLSNVDADTGQWLRRPHTILVDSAAIESGESFSKEFKEAAATEIEAFKHEYARQHPGADLSKISDGDLLREVMNTVGKRGMLGEQIRCVVSVSMLTEGWDANTVTHILGVRAFRSQLLCEQVVGRGLRRRSYVPNPTTGKFEVEYADVYGVPFAFIPSDRKVATPKPARPAVEVFAVAGREDLEITFPKLGGYRIEMPEGIVFDDFGPEAAMHVSRDTVAVWTRSSGIAGAGEDIDIDRYRDARQKEVAFRIAALLVNRFDDDGDMPVTDQRSDDGHSRDLTPERPPAKPWLFAKLVGLADRWLTECVTYADDAFVGLLLPAQAAHRAAEKLFGAIVQQLGNEPEILLPMFRRFDPEGSTADVDFLTRKAVIEATRSQVSHVVLDGPKGNSWEEGMAAILEKHDDVRAYAKNDHLGFVIPYVHEGRAHEYWPDFLVRLRPDDSGRTRTLIVEVSGGQKDPLQTAAKADTARDHWCAAVNNHGGWGLWGYVEVTSMAEAGPGLNEAIADLYELEPSSRAPVMGAFA